MPRPYFCGFPSHPRSIALFLINQISISAVIVYGFDFLWPPHLKDLIYTGSSGFFVAELALLIFYVSNIRSWGGSHEGAGRTAALLCTFQTSLTEFFFLPTHAALALIALTFVVGAALMRYASHVAAIGWAMAIGFALYVGSILMITDYGSRADMLPFIAHAIDIFLTGRYPYTADSATSPKTRSSTRQRNGWLFYRHKHSGSICASSIC